MELTTVRYEVADGVATIALDQPDSRNALSNELLTDLLAAFTAAREDDAVRAVVLTSTHETTFSAGGSLSGFAADEPLVLKHWATTKFPELFALIGGLRQPPIAAVHHPRPAGAARLAPAGSPLLRHGSRAGRHAPDQRRGVSVL